VCIPGFVQGIKMQKYRIKSFSEDKYYEVIWHDDGMWTCQCVFNHYHPYKPCEHILKAQGKPTKHLLKAADKFNKLIRTYKNLNAKMLKTNIGKLKTIEKYYQRLEKLKDKIIKSKNRIEEIK